MLRQWKPFKQAAKDQLQEELFGDWIHIKYRQWYVGIPSECFEMSGASSDTSDLLKMH